MDHPTLFPTRYLPAVARWILQGALPADPMEALGAAPRGRLLELPGPADEPHAADRCDTETPHGWAA
jgi:hypothetical protein